MCLAQAVELLTRNRGKLDALVQALLERDTLNEEEILSVTGLTPQGDTVREVPELVAPAT